jgi:hypothetical protein
MNLNIKKLINGCLYAGVGLFGFIFMAFDYFFIYSGNQSASYPLGQGTGYGFIGFNAYGSELEFFKILTSILLVFVIISCIALLALGAVKILDACGIEITFLTPYNALIEKITKIFTLVYMCINGAAFFFTLVWCLANTKTWMGFAPGVSAYLLLIFAVAAYVVPVVLDKQMPDQAAGPRTVFVCAKCGKKCANGAKFCDACGGEVVSKLQYPVVFVCSKCGAKASRNDKFCSACGAPVVKKEIRPTTYVCSACGKPASEGEKFCGACGGAIIQK